MTFQPTAEQQTAVELFATGASMKIEAGAGSGKTSTLILLANSPYGQTKRIQYVAFNKAIVTDAEAKTPGNVRCNTAHSLAYRAVGKDYSARLRNSRRMKSFEIANILGLDPINVTTYTGETKTLSPSFLAGVVLNAVERFCQTGDPEIADRHVPYIPGLDAAPKADRPTSYAVNNYVAKALVPYLRAAWRDLTQYRGNLPYKHSHYLKAWQLSGPKIEADVILFDEAQDANPVMTAIVAAQTHAQVVWVGDSQQQIYTFTGAVNALQTIPADKTAYLTQSFRFGPAVAEVANLVLNELAAAIRLTGFEKIRSTVGPVAEPDAILCRTNAAAVRHVLNAIENGQRPHLVGGGGEIAAFCRGARDLKAGRRSDHPDLACFDTWGEVLTYVEQDEQGGDLLLMVRLIDEFGVQTILDALDASVTEAAADVIVSTAHKSKGREWDRVALASDFPEDKVGDEEKRLLYVACTRARLELDITAVAYLVALAGEGSASGGGSPSAAPGNGTVPSLGGGQDEIRVRPDRYDRDEAGTA